MAEPNATPDPKGEGAGSGEPKTYTQEEWSGLQSKYEKTSSAMKKQISNMESELTDTRAKIEALDEGKGKNDEEFVQLKTDYARKVKLLERRETDLVTRELKLHAEAFAKEYGVDVNDLTEFKSVAEMENYALKEFIKKADSKKGESPPSDKFDRRTGSTGNTRTSVETLSKVDISKMTPKELAEHKKEYEESLLSSLRKR